MRTLLELRIAAETQNIEASSTMRLRQSIFEALQNVSRETLGTRAAHARHKKTASVRNGRRSPSCGSTQVAKLLRSANAADRGTAVGALALRDGLAVLRRALDGILHDLLRLALHAVSFDGHG